MNIRTPATPARLSRIGGALALAAGAALSLGSGIASAQVVNFQGNTDGCFGIACTPAATATLGGLTYNDSTFNVTSAGGIAGLGSIMTNPNIDNLGSFSLTGTPFGYSGNFALTVNFTVPSTTSPSSVVFQSDLTGTVASSDNGAVFIDFDNAPRNFTFGSGQSTGTFRLSVNDLTILAGQTVTVSGNLRTQVSAIPEPETYALMMAGLAAVGFMSRRRKKA